MSKKKTFPTNITVQKIDTTVTTMDKDKIKKESMKETLSKQVEPENKNEKDKINTVLSIVSEEYPKNLSTHTFDKKSLEKYTGESLHTEVNTEELLQQYNTKNNSSGSSYNTYFLNFQKKTPTNSDVYFIFAKHVKKNRQCILDTLIKENVIYNRNIPFRLLLHHYANYLNGDIIIDHI